MMAVAPNLTVLVGELVGARLIAHAGSLLNLAKHPSSTVQILGAEKALFRAMKTKHDTPKYGLIYHASLVGQTSAKLKGKVSRMLAAKAALAIRVDALGEDTQATIGIEQRADLERKFALLEQNAVRILFFLSLFYTILLQTKRISGTGKMQSKFEKYQKNSYVFIDYIIH
jgi:nucleolar protein 58